MKKQKKPSTAQVMADTLARLEARIVALERSKEDWTIAQAKYQSYQNKKSDDYCPKCGKKLISGPFFGENC